MARRTFEVIDVVEILQHWHAGRPKTVVADSLGVDAKTVRKYVAPAEAAGLAPGGPPLSRSEWAQRVAAWFPELGDGRARSLTFPVIDAHRDQIKVMLATNKPTTVWQRLRDEAGLEVSLTSFRRYLWLEFPEQADPSKVTVLRPDVPAGEEALCGTPHSDSYVEPPTMRRRGHRSSVCGCSQRSGAA
jgi:hypothetical protein